MALLATNLKTRYEETNEVLPKTYQRVLVFLVLAVALVAPTVLSNFFVHLLNLSLLAAIGAMGLALLTGYCGQVSLGHAAFLAIGGFTTVIMTVHLDAPFLLVVVMAGIAGGVLGYIVGLPSLRFRGIYLAISTLAMHYAIVFVATSYQAGIGASASAGVPIPNPSIGSFVLSSDRVWYYVLLVIVAAVTVFCLNLLRTRPGRAWMAIRDRDIAAVALGVNIAHYKLLAFVVSSVLASVSGALLAYYSNVVTVEKYTLDLAVVYLAMIIVGGMGSIFGAIVGAMFITLLPYGIEYVFEFLPSQWRYGSILFGFQFGAVGLVVILFLVLQPKGLAEVWRRIEIYFLRWPFRYRPLDSTRR